MPADALRFIGEVFDSDGTSLGEARFWGSCERGMEDQPWQGWLQISDLGTTALPRGHYRVASNAGWDAEFEPVTGTPARVFEIDLIPIRGTGAVPWPEAASATTAPYRAFWDGPPPRTADDCTRFPDLSPLGLAPSDGVLPPDLPWPATPEP